MLLAGSDDKILLCENIISYGPHISKLLTINTIITNITNTNNTIERTNKKRETTINHTIERKVERNIIHIIKTKYKEIQKQELKETSVLLCTNSESVIIIPIPVVSLTWEDKLWM